MGPLSTLVMETRGGCGEGLKGSLKLDVLILTDSTVAPTGTEEARLLPSVLMFLLTLSSPGR